MAAMMMDGPRAFDEEEGDAVFPCKGCGDILEEGKAFELAGQRWHIDCFRCNTCGTLLDSDANLLLLGDGSLICNNCTYSCNACGNKIEDLAILTGDQAFCASCFRCRNCKRKIENLRYARTSQGIFCMSCHESLMARRRKKAKAAPRQATAGSNGPTAAVEKALPSLPPGAAPEPAFSPEIETPPSEIFNGTASTRSPRQPQLKPGRDASATNLKRDVSPMSDEARKDGLTLPASTYGDSRPSNVSDDIDDGDERGFLRMAYDPTPAPGPPPTIARKQVPRQDLSPPSQSENRPPKDYFSGGLPAKSLQRDALREEQRPASSRSVSTEREPERRNEVPKVSPHIFYQEKGRSTRKRDTSGPNTPASASAAASPTVVSAADGRMERPKPQHLDTGSYTLGHGDAFRLQEVPKTKKSSSRSASKADGKSPVMDSPAGLRGRQATETTVPQSPVSVDSQGSGVNPFDDPRRRDGGATVAPPPPKHADRPARGDSLAAAMGSQRSRSATPSPPTPTTVHTPNTTSTQQLAPNHDRHGSASSATSSIADAQSTLPRNNTHSNPVESSPPPRGSFDAPPPRASSRPIAPSKSVANGDFVMPRQPPPLPPIERHKNSESISTLQSVDTRSEDQLSPALRSSGLPKHSAEGGFSMEDEMARILRGDTKREARDDNAVPSSVLRRVSNAVKHGRSFSDRGHGFVANKSQSSRNGSVEISSPRVIGSPVISSPTSKEPLEQLRSQNRRQGQRIAELEADKAALEDRLNNSADIKAATSELREKRNTMVVLDTQREMVVAELESMTAHLQQAKDSSQPLDLHSLKSDILRDFADSLQRLKESMHGQVEDLMHKRSELTDEIGTLIQMKDKGFQEYESLTTRNADLLEMNNQLVHNIQETYKANRVPNGVAPPGSGNINGLGIYHPGAKPEIPQPSEVRNLNLVNTDSSMPNLLHEKEAEPAHILAAPQVVNIRKGQPKKFNWRKGGQTVAKNVTKGIKATFVGDSVRGKEIGAPYGADIGGMPYGQSQAIAGSEQSSLNSKQPLLDGRGGGGGQGFGFFASSQKNGGGLKAGGALGSMKNNSNTNLATPAAADPSVLFGSELEARCDYEHRLLPAMVTRCVEEVEARGMQVEGIYRKSGGAGQVKAVQQGFEKDGNHDISDPDLDIHAVTSALKQYFRRLPTPLITYDVYDFLLDAGQTAEKEMLALNLRAAVAELPEHHRGCLEYLVQHLARVMAQGGANLMTPLNLAVVFAPTIMRPVSIEREMSDMGAQRTALQALLENHEEVFAVGGDE
ncbi:Rho-type gtpase-activating protein [Friedmanniomyces endolithicus]|nr:Rho-type gtpase-activating protein [Friedmanniomyces endolithicus]